ncbi:class I SAM-dependent methyltransferase [Halomonas sabkhae]|uniref:class I SAM-dependent methyltransferase n=1 Tax=Halomonas sabkhae TaxID=626223 RepID=UPI0025B498FE|nr:class I SAM-dependent methyltransferase [Halomonas sabkhae]MDN3524818.1 class I SAM-dependent methyltransferase [Halomonas sabkhae]
MSDGSHFAAAWLALREPVDARSRAGSLDHAVAAWLATRAAPHGRAVSVLDLGAGSGSNLRYLAPRLGLAQQWTLLDQDAGLLAQATRQLPSLPDSLEVSTRCADMRGWCEAPEVLDAWLDGVELVTASALLDLVSQPWVEALAAAVSRRQAAVLIALSVDGDWQLDAADPDHDAASQRAHEDQWMRRHYRAHQATDKGAGAALGGAAPEAMASALQAHGYRLQMADSPWVLQAPADRALGEALLEGWREAVSEQVPDAVVEVERWHAARLASWQRGELIIRVGHRDLLALPDSEGHDHG